MSGTAHRLRWSSARDCRRKAIYEAQGAPHRERTHREERVLWRGRAVGHEFLLAVAHESRRTIWVCTGQDFTLPYPDVRASSQDYAGILAEMPVEWEFGIGHADAFIRDAETVVEVVSSLNPDGELIHSKLLQAGGYARQLDARAACVAIVNPSTLEDERVVVVRGTEKWDALMGEVDECVAELAAWERDGTMPSRVCLQPSDAWGHFCLFAQHCFEDAPAWSPAEVLDLESDDAQLLAITLAQIKTRRRALKSEDRMLDDEQRAIQAQLGAHVPEGKWRAGGYEVRRSIRAGRRTFDFARADLDGRFPEGLVAEFTKYGDPFEVWDVEKTGDVVVTTATDEEVPF